jgi:hypothetical protein
MNSVVPIDRKPAVVEEELPGSPAFQRHFTVDELSELWHIDAKLVRRMFLNEPGVVKFGRPESRYKRGYISLRIPATVVERVHNRLVTIAA